MLDSYVNEEDLEACKVTLESPEKTVPAEKALATAIVLLGPAWVALVFCVALSSDPSMVMELEELMLGTHEPVGMDVVMKD